MGRQSHKGQQHRMGPELHKNRDRWVKEKLVLPLAFTVSNFSTKGKGENSNDYAIRLEGPDGGWQRAD